MAFAVVDLRAEDPVTQLLARLPIAPDDARGKQLVELMAQHMKYAELPAELEPAR